MAIETGGTAARWEVLYSSAGFRIRAVDGSEVELLSFDEGSPVSADYAGWWVAYLRVNQTAGMFWQFDARPLQDTSGATADASGTLAPGTVGAPTAVGTNTTVDDGSSFSVGHVVVYDIFGGPQWDLGWLDLGLQRLDRGDRRGPVPAPVPGAERPRRGRRRLPHRPPR